MPFFRSLEDVRLERSCVTIGTFDGVHLGHQALLRDMVRSAHSQKLKSVVISFHPHPREVLSGRAGNFYLTLPSERASLLYSVGMDAVFMLPFDAQFAATSAADFVHSMVRHLGMQQLWVGHDFALGRGREGNVTRLRALGEEMSFGLVVVEPVKQEATIISSSLIRSLISTGEVMQAAMLLGRPYQLSGEVVPGDQRGRKLGIPTANLSPLPGKLIPAPGVYACRSEVDNQRYAAAVNIGVRPTFASSLQETFIEAHFLDFSGDLYGKVVRLEFEQRLRNEMRFETIEALLMQVRLDIQRTREIFRRG